MKILLTILLTILSTNAKATVKRGEFTSNGYVMHYERNDYKTRGQGYQGYQPYKYQPYQPYQPYKYYQD